MSDNLKFVGKPYKRIDGPAKATGSAKYVQDMQLPGMLYARILLSPHASAKILSIDTSQAEKLPGVHAVLVGKELNYKIGLYMIDKDILARDQVRYDGEAVAAVAAEEEWIAEKACSLIKVEYQPLKPVLCPLLALEKDAPLVHEKLGEYDYMKGVFHPKAGTNISHHQKIRKGDMEKGFEKAHRIFEYEFQVPPVSHGFMETHTAIVEAKQDDTVEIITSAQSPYTVRNLFSVCFRIPHKKIRVKVPYVGGGFGGKAGINIEPLLYCLSKKSGGRPVKMTVTREESLKTMPARQGLISRIKAGFLRDGKICALEVKYYWDAGAYADYGVNIGRAAAYSGAGPYHIENCSVDSFVLYTNKTFGTAYRGFGHLEVLYGIERMFDLVAVELDLDPYDIRMKNVLRDGDLTITGEKIGPNHGRPDICLEKVANEIAWHEKKPKKAPDGRLYGRGLALLHKAPAMPSSTSCAVILKFNEDASADLMVSGIDYGQGTYTALAQIAAEELRIQPDNINVIFDSDTAFSPYDWQTVASRFSFMGGIATIRAAQDCLKQFKAMASCVLRAPIEEIEYEDGRVFVHHNPEKFISFDQMALGYVYENGNAIGGPVIGHGRYIAQGLTNLDENGQGLPALEWTFGAHGVEILVDPSTGDIEILKIASAFDAGQVLNPQQATAQIVGGIIQGIGSTLFEEYCHDGSGRFLNASFVDYKLPTVNDVPEKIVPIFVKTPQLDGPYGARGIAEHPMISVPGAVANALAQATGIEFFTLPLKPEKVFLAMKNRRDKN